MHEKYPIPKITKITTYYRVRKNIYYRIYFFWRGDVILLGPKYWPLSEYPSRITSTEQVLPAVGDCSKNIHVWKPAEGGVWNISTQPFRSHTRSVEDIRWPEDRQSSLLLLESGCIAEGEKFLLPVLRISWYFDSFIAIFFYLVFVWCYRLGVFPLYAKGYYKW